jgi:hypothetical protein
VSGAEIGRREHNVRLLFTRKRTEPPSERDRLSLTELREWDVHITNVDVYHVVARLQRRVASDVAGGFAVAYDVEQIGPDLV